MLKAVHLQLFVPTCRYFSAQTVQSSSKTWRVSSLGRVQSLNGMVCYGYLHPSGYRYVHINRLKLPVHRVVMITFNGLPTCDKAWQVHHVDGDRGNNCLINLEYVTASQNCQYSHAHRSQKGMAFRASKPVMSQLIGSKEWVCHSSVTAAARQLGVARGTVSRACSTKSPAKGHVFRLQEATEASHPGEEWRAMLDPTSGAEVCGRMVSSFGRISSKSGTITRGHLNRIGYRQTGVGVGGHYRTVQVHRLVAAAFIGAPQAAIGMHVNHKDMDKSNNAADNLEYVTPAENAAHFHAHAADEGFKRSTGQKPVWSKAYGIDEPWKWHASLRSAASVLGLKSGNISQCANGKAKRTGNYEFQFADVPEWHPLPGEKWRDVDVLALQQDRQSRL